MKTIEAIEDFKTELLVNRKSSTKTVEAYVSDLKAYCEYLKEHNVEDMENITNALVNQYAHHLSDTLKQTSAARKVSSIRSLHKFISYQYDTDNPALNIAMHSKKIHLPEYYDTEQVDALEEFLEDDKNKTYHKAIIETLYATGMRVSELCELKMSQLNEEQRLIRVRGKGDKERIVPIAEESYQVLNLYINTDRASWNKKQLPNIFVNRFGKKLTRQYVFHLVKKTGEKAGLDKSLSPHSFRHGFATGLLEGGADMRSVQELLGHSDVSTTQIYTHVKKKELFETYSKFHPGNNIQKEK